MRFGAFEAFWAGAIFGALAVKFWAWHRAWCSRPDDGGDAQAFMDAFNQDRPL